VETFISGSGLQNRYREKTHESLSAEAIFERARDHDQTAQYWVEDWAIHFGRALANVINCVDPDIVVIGGGLSNEESVYTLGVQELHRFIFSDVVLTPVVRNQLGDSAGVIGAALLGRAS
jgi:fructokinase